MNEVFHNNAHILDELLTKMYANTGRVLTFRYG
jgi:hypothetical protein